MGDIILLIILVGLTFLGYKKGFLRTLTGIISIILSFALALTFCPRVEEYIKSTPVYDKIYENIEKKIGTDDKKEESIVSELNLPREMLNSVKENAEEVENKVIKSLAEKIGDLAVKILSIALIFIAVRILIMLFMFGFGFIKKLPFIGWFDRLLGALFGFLRGLLVVYLLLIVVMISATFNADNIIVKSVNNSEFAKVMYNNNVFFDFIKND